MVHLVVFQGQHFLGVEKCSGSPGVPKVVDFEAAVAAVRPVT